MKQSQRLKMPDDRMQAMHDPRCSVMHSDERRTNVLIHDTESEGETRILMAYRIVPGWYRIVPGWYPSLSSPQASSKNLGQQAHLTTTL